MLPVAGGPVPVTRQFVSGWEFFRNKKRRMLLKAMLERQKDRQSKGWGMVQRLSERVERKKLILQQLEELLKRKTEFSLFATRRRHELGRQLDEMQVVKE